MEDNDIDADIDSHARVLELCAEYLMWLAYPHFTYKDAHSAVRVGARQFLRRLHESGEPVGETLARAKLTAQAFYKLPLSIDEGRDENDRSPSRFILLKLQEAQSKGMTAGQIVDVVGDYEFDIDATQIGTLLSELVAEGRVLKDGRVYRTVAGTSAGAAHPRDRQASKICDFMKLTMSATTAPSNAVVFDRYTITVPADEALRTEVLLRLASRWEQAVAEIEAEVRANGGDTCFATAIVAAGQTVKRKNSL